MCLHCLSAFGLFGTQRPVCRAAIRARVFIAFRLLVCLGRYDGLRVLFEYLESSLPFGFWSVWDDLQKNKRFHSGHCLHCLSAFGLFGTVEAQAIGAMDDVSSLPFGFWSVWDTTY